jgi:hypothetical protein
VISACLPTLRPLLVKTWSQFGSLTNSKVIQSGPNSRSLGPIELVTIGGTGGSKSGGRYFQRLGNEEGKYGSHTAITRSESLSRETSHGDSGSGDGLTLNSGIKASIKRDMEI